MFLFCRLKDENKAESREQRAVLWPRSGISCNKRWYERSLMCVCFVPDMIWALCPCVICKAFLEHTLCAVCTCPSTCIFIAENGSLCCLHRACHVCFCPQLVARCFAPSLWFNHLFLCSYQPQPCFLHHHFRLFRALYYVCIVSM
jgi:hypothetical protein